MSLNLIFDPVKDMKEVLFLHMRKLKFIDIMILIMCLLNVALQGNRLYFITERDLKSTDFNIQTGCLTYTGNEKNTWKTLPKVKFSKI